jgi:hypothetical protein
MQCQLCFLRQTSIEREVTLQKYYPLLFKFKRLFFFAEKVPQGIQYIHRDKRYDKRSLGKLITAAKWYGIRDVGCGIRDRGWGICNAGYFSTLLLPEGKGGDSLSAVLT